MIRFIDDDLDESIKEDIAWAIIFMLGGLIAIYALTTFISMMIGTVEGFLHAYHVWRERKRLSTVVSTMFTTRKPFEDENSEVGLTGDPMMKILS